jgi:hypothetical protein
MTITRSAGRRVAKRALAALAGLLLVAGPATAQPKGPEPDPARLAAAREMFQAQGGTEQARKSLEEATKAIIAETRQSNPDIADGLERFLKGYFSPESTAIKQLLDDVLNLSARFYASRFTVEEMRELTGFLRSPVGQKFVSAAPEASAAVAPRLVEFQQKLMIALQMAAGRGEFNKK